MKLQLIGEATYLDQNILVPLDCNLLYIIFQIFNVNPDVALNLSSVWITLQADLGAPAVCTFFLVRLTNNKK